MSTAPHETFSTPDETLVNISFDYPGADIILRSQDSHCFQVPKSFIASSSPVLGELIRRTLGSACDTDADSLPVVQLPDSGQILHYLLTFIFPVTPVIPSNPEEAMELLSVAQKYQMGTVLIHIRGSIARESPLPTQLEPALRIYSLAQTYGLRPEALQTARNILRHSITVENFDNMLEFMSGASLYELLKYYEGVRAILASDLTEFRESAAHDTMRNIVRCTPRSSSQVPSWIDAYIESIGKTPNLLDLLEFNAAMLKHIKATAAANTCECVSISSQAIRKFWEALASVVNGSYDRAESFLCLVQERQDPQAEINPTMSPSSTFEVPDADIIIRSSDLVDFRVHKSVLAMTSPFFKDLLSLPQPSDSETFDGLPVVQLPEDSELLRSLVSMLYPVPTVIPRSYEKVLYLLAASQKFDMVSVQALIRAEVSRGEFPAPKGAEAFSAYAIASSKGLTLEMENTARQTLEHPMTFEIFGEGLRSIEGWALRDLANFRKRCRNNLVACFKSFLQLGQPPFNIWAPCVQVSVSLRYFSQSIHQTGASPLWLTQVFQNRFNESRDAFSKPFFNPRNIRWEYLSALNAHIIPNTCISCTNVHAQKGEAFCKELEDRLTQALDEKLVIHE